MKWQRYGPSTGPLSPTATAWYLPSYGAKKEPDSPNTETQGSPKVTSRRGRGTVCAVPERNQMAGGSKGQPPRSWWTRSRRETESNNTDTACYEACKLEKVRA